MKFVLHWRINPVTGCFEHLKPNPLEGMSEEQKEYEALQLVGLVDKLTRFALLIIYEYNIIRIDVIIILFDTIFGYFREGVVHPCRIGDDGRPKPIEHVLELQEELPKQQYTRQDSDSDWMLSYLYIKLYEKVNIK